MKVLGFILLALLGCAHAQSENDDPVTYELKVTCAGAQIKPDLGLSDAPFTPTGRIVEKAETYEWKGIKGGESGVCISPKGTGDIIFRLDDPSGAAKRLQEREAKNRQALATGKGAVTLSSYITAIGGRQVSTDGFDPEDTTQTWDAVFTAKNDAVGRLSFHAFITPAKTYTRAISVAYKGSYSTGGPLEILYSKAVNIGTRCFSIQATRWKEISQWLDEKARQVNGNANYTRDFGDIRVSNGFSFSGSTLTAYIQFARNSVPGGSSWPNYCTLR